MKRNDYMDTSDIYTYSGIDCSNIKIEPKKVQKKVSKRYVCIDLEMTEFTPAQRMLMPGANGEIIQFGAVMLDENYNMISEFNSFVKPVYSSVTQTIHNLTGITNNIVEHADDFITVFDKFSYWRGEGDITTFCWSTVDHKQLWNELETKGKHRYDLFALLQDFVDLQDIFGKLVDSHQSISLESAMKLLNMNFEGQVHSALSDSFNTARILHKLFCTQSLNLNMEYMNHGKKHKANPIASKYQMPEENFGCSFASFMSPELRAQFGYVEEEEKEDTFDDVREIIINHSIPTQLTSAENIEEIISLCSKYKIEIDNWAKVIEQVNTTSDMLVA